MNTFEEFKEAFYRHLEQLFALIRGKHGSDADEAMVSYGESEEERDTLRLVLEETELEHQLKKELRESGKKPGQWFDEEIERTVRTVVENPTDDDVRKVKEKMEEALASDITESAEQLKVETEEKEATKQETAEQGNAEENDHQKGEGGES